MVRFTKQRKVILEELGKVTSHPTADEVYEMVRKRLPRVSLATVYRNLESLSEEGVIRRLDMAGTKRRYDATTENHYHLRCMVCGRVEDVHIPVFRELDEEMKRMQNSTGFVLKEHRLEFRGVCPECAERAGEKRHDN